MTGILGVVIGRLRAPCDRHFAVIAGRPLWRSRISKGRGVEPGMVDHEGFGPSTHWRHGPMGRSYTCLGDQKYLESRQYGASSGPSRSPATVGVGSPKIEISQLDGQWKGRRSRYRPRANPLRWQQAWRSPQGKRIPRIANHRCAIQVAIIDYGLTFESGELRHRDETTRSADEQRHCRVTA